MGNFRISVILNAEPEVVYNAWLDSKTHSRFTGSPAKIDPNPGGVFTAWDGYISGKTLMKDYPRRIVQCWRTSDFPEGSQDSRLEVFFEPDGDGVRLEIIHSLIPDEQVEMYKKGWNDFYFIPMKSYFG